MKSSDIIKKYEGVSIKEISDALYELIEIHVNIGVDLSKPISKLERDLKTIKNYYLKTVRKRLKERCIDKIRIKYKDLEERKRLFKSKDSFHYFLDDLATKYNDDDYKLGYEFFNFYYADLIENKSEAAFTRFYNEIKEQVIDKYDVNR